MKNSLFKSVLWAFLGFLAGMVVAFALIVAVEIFSAAVYPAPPGAKESFEIMCNHVARYPHWILGVVVFLWSVTAFAGTWVATRIGANWAGLSLALLLAVGLVTNIYMLPYTMWFKIVMLCCFPVACYFGLRTAASRLRTPKPSLGIE